MSVSHLVPSGSPFIGGKGVNHIQDGTDILKKATVDSTCQRNTLFNNFFWLLNFRIFLGLLFSWAATVSSSCWEYWARHVFLGEVLSDQPIGIFIRPPLPGTLRITEVNLHPSVCSKLQILGQFHAAIPCQRLSELTRQRLKFFCNCLIHRTSIFST